MLYRHALFIEAKNRIINKPRPINTPIVLPSNGRPTITGCPCGPRQ